MCVLRWWEPLTMVSDVNNPVDIYLLNVNNRTTRTRCEICSKLTINTPERRQWHRPGLFIVNFEYISHFVLVFLSLILNMRRLKAFHRSIILQRQIIIHHKGSWEFYCFFKLWRDNIETIMPNYRVYAFIGGNMNCTGFIYFNLNRQLAH